MSGEFKNSSLVYEQIEAILTHYLSLHEVDEVMNMIQVESSPAEIVEKLEEYEVESD